jgi:CBS domain-containing protein
MKVKLLISGEVQTCLPHDSLADAARKLWDHDCGVVAVVDEHGEVAGMLTDRDICMAASMTGKPLAELRVDSAMAKKVFTCRPEDPLHTAETLMRAHQVRRLAVVDGAHKLVGILSLNDIARYLSEQQLSNSRQMDSDHLVQTLAAIGKARKAVKPVVPPLQQKKGTATAADA